MNSISTNDRFRGCLLGLACGDAIGTTVLAGNLIELVQFGK